LYILTIVVDFGMIIAYLGYAKIALLWQFAASRLFFVVFHIKSITVTKEVYTKTQETYF